MAIYDATGLLVRLNTAFNQLLDGADLVLLDASGAPLAAADLPQRRVLDNVTSPGVSSDVFIRIAGGALLALSPAASLRRDAHGDLVGVVVVFRDVTERHCREQALRERADLLVTAFAVMPDAVYRHDAAGAFLAANPAHRAALGYASLPAPSAPLEERAAALDPRDAAGSALPPHRWPIERVLAGQTLSGDETCAMTVRGLDGVDRTFDVTGAPFLDAADRIAGGVLVSREVGERLRLRAERAALASQVQQLIESERSRLHDVLEQIPAAIALTEGPEHRFTYVNPRYARWPRSRVWPNCCFAAWAGSIARIAHLWRRAWAH